jgi:hypothetical protein
MRPEQICERIARKDTGCLPRLLDLGLTGELQLHVEILRNELEISGKIGDGNAGSVYPFPSPRIFESLTSCSITFFFHVPTGTKADTRAKTLPLSCFRREL